MRLAVQCLEQSRRRHQETELRASKELRRQDTRRADGAAARRDQRGVDELAQGDVGDLNVGTVGEMWERDKD